jgi:hypothetical protein
MIWEWAKTTSIGWQHACRAIARKGGTLMLARQKCAMEGPSIEKNGDSNQL